MTWQIFEILLKLLHEIPLYVKTDLLSVLTDQHQMLWITLFTFQLETRVKSGKLYYAAAKTQTNSIQMFRVSTHYVVVVFVIYFDQTYEPYIYIN